MKFNTYDIVIIKKPFTLTVNEKVLSFPSNIEGVIVENYDSEFLIEFKDDNDTYYVLIAEDYLVKNLINKKKTKPLI